MIGCSFSSPNKIGIRSLSMFDVLSDSLAKDLAENEEVNDWVNSLRQDPFVKAVSSTSREVGHYTKLALSVTSSIANTIFLPITKPLSKILKPKKIKFTKCPFPPANSLNISGKGEIAQVNLNLFDRFKLSMKNISNRAEISDVALIKGAFKVSEALLSIPLKFIGEPSKESLVITSIQRYFPTYNTAAFLKWAEESFLPFFVDNYLRGTLILKLAAEPNITQERQVQIAEYVTSGMTVKSKLLSVYNVDSHEFEFKNGNPVIVVRCNADYIENIVDRRGVSIIGGPEFIKRVDLMLGITINNTGEEPVWKVNEVSIGAECRRI
ncbi:hypothetical protein GPJ56_011057 [Histomonas meleagridis]|uniref:uncharacterized protein n=1 Tax=Histomonas meleagridis TaxID=135588 RepID=UPI003559A5D7|nr:hypothetical protein GPJ56_011057 [Histomonas meleagridis]KAH0800834.1 hypothetical protein GO595_006587 [Histomonas meleagridis]